MTSRLGDRLHAARRRQLIGRTRERGLFLTALDADELPFHVLYIFGPGGIGKTTLLGEFAALCEERHIPYALLDAHTIEPQPETLIAALPPPLTPVPEQDLASSEQADACSSTRYVLLIDTYEELLPLDRWLRQTLLPQLPEATLIVLASNNPPALEWRTDPGWRELVRLLPLRNLNPEESRRYLGRRGVPAEQCARVLAFTHGHPLALSLVADLFAQRRDVDFQPEAEPDIIRALLERLVQKVPGPAHRATVEVCALVRQTTEALL
ncbi:MAG TPA: ATP-binding protein, partial [Ktedonobacterales bacterium]|nr:ATP-binding protein [Ktedonobacterales bacterium]